MGACGQEQGDAFSAERVASYALIDDTPRCMDREDPDLLVPDLQTDVSEVLVSEYLGERRVRFSSTVFNMGEGPFIL